MYPVRPVVLHRRRFPDDRRPAARGDRTAAPPDGHRRLQGAGQPARGGQVAAGGPGGAGHMSTILSQFQPPLEGPPGIRSGPTLLVFDLTANKVITDAALDSIDKYLLQPDHIVWLDLANPDLQDIQCLRE